MSLEQKIELLTAAVEANTAAIKAQGATAGAAADKPAGKAPAKEKAAAKEKADTPKHTHEECVAALTKIKDEHGIAHAKEILTKHKIGKMAEIPADKFDVVYAEAVAKYDELSGADGGDDGEGDGL